MQIVRRRQNKIEINLLGLLQLFWSNKFKILFSSLFAGIMCLGVAMFAITPQYTAHITLYANKSNSADKTTSITSSDISASMQLVDTYAAIILTDSVLDNVIQQLNLDMTCDDLVENISIEAVNETEVFKVSVKDPSPQLAAQIANKISEVAPEHIESIVDGCSVKLVNSAKVPSVRTTPSYKKFLLFGMVIGLFICLFALTLNVVIDTRIKSEEDLKDFGLPMLTNVPDFREAQRMATYGYGYHKGGR